MFRPLLKDRSKQSSLCLLTGAVSLFFAAGCVSAKLTGGNLSDIGLLVAAAIGITAVAWSCYRHYKLLRLEILELRAQNLQLDRAVNNITQALIVFDGQANLVLCNERYRQMYGLCPEMVRPGTSLHSLLLHRKEARGSRPIRMLRICTKRSGRRSSRMPASLPSSKRCRQD